MVEGFNRGIRETISFVYVNFCFLVLDLLSESIGGKVNFSRKFLVFANSLTRSK